MTKKESCFFSGVVGNGAIDQTDRPCCPGCHGRLLRDTSHPVAWKPAEEAAAELVTFSCHGRLVM